MLFLGRPAHLESLRWWYSPTVVVALGLTSDDSESIDRIYEERSTSRRQCIERMVAATNRANRLIREEAYDARTTDAVQEAISAVADERALTRAISNEVAALLSSEQRRLLAQIRPGPAVD